MDKYKLVGREFYEQKPENPYGCRGGGLSKRKFKIGGNVICLQD